MEILANDRCRIGQQQEVVDDEMEPISANQWNVSTMVHGVGVPESE
ncbi:hypothetical protein STSO111631_09370 [Stackebrandtia soli]